MTDFQEKAQEIVKDSQPHITHYEIPEDYIPYLIEQITEALKAAYKQGAGARIELPDSIQAHQGLTQQKYSFAEGWNACLDAIKITPLTVDDVFPDHEGKELLQHCEAGIQDMQSEDQIHEPDWAFSEGFYVAARFIREYVNAKLEGK